MNHELSEIGLTEKESKVYFHLLGVGNASPRDIANDLGIARSTAYVVLESLEKKGYVLPQKDAETSIYVASKPDVLLQHVDTYLDKFESAEKTLGELSEMFDEMDPKFGSEPAISFFEEGSESNIYKDILRSEETQIFCVLSAKPKSSVVEERALSFYKTLSERNILLSGLMERGCALLGSLKPVNGNRIEVLKSPFDIDTDVFIYGEKIALVSYGESFGAIIKTPDIASAMRELLLLAMKEAEYEKANEPILTPVVSRHE